MTVRNFARKPTFIILMVCLLIVIVGGAFGYRFLKTDVATDLIPVRVPIDIWPGNFWVIVGDAKGFFQEEGLKPELIDVSANYNQWVDDFATKDVIDTMNLAVFDLVNKNIEGADLMIVFVSDNSEGAEGMVAKKDFKKPEDLRGKRIGVELGSYLEFFLEVAMLNSGVDKNEYTMVNLLTDDLINDFEKENLDAAFAWEPLLSEIANKYDLEKIFDTSDLRGLSPGVFAFKRSMIENNPDTVKALVRVWAKASDYTLKNPEEAYRIVSKTSFKDNPKGFYSYEEIKELSKQDIILNLEDNLTAFSFNAGFESLYGNLQYVGSFFRKDGLIPSSTDAYNMATDYFIKRIYQK